MEKKDAHDEAEDVGACRDVWAPEIAADGEAVTGISISSPHHRKLGSTHGYRRLRRPEVRVDRF